MKSSKTTRALIESAMMVALATVLSIFKIIEMPYGGSVTIASMLPVIILSYRHGMGWGLGGGLVFAVVQQLLGLKSLSYFTTWRSVLAIILLDYIIAFTVVGLGGVFRRAMKSQRLALTSGAILASVLRYICHCISGSTVWVGLSIPDEAAILYSLGYNATYMLPEAIVLSAVAYYIGSMIDFSRTVPTRITRPTADGDGSTLVPLSGLSFLVGAIIDIWLIAPCMQDAESGQFIFSGLSEVNWVAVAIVSVLTMCMGVAMLLMAKRKSDNSAE